MTGTGSNRLSWSNMSVLALMTLVLLVAGMLSAVTAMKFAIQGTEVMVPDLIGAREAEAQEVLLGAGLEMSIDGRRFSSDFPAGEILDQSPASGVRVKSDRRVRVRVSLGEQEFPVPDVIGASLRSTQLSLNQRGLAVGSTLYAHSSNQDAGTIVFQEPRAGATGSDPAVDVLVSLGGIEQYFVMPKLTELTVAEARNVVRAAGFRLTEVPDGEAAAPPGRVLSQQPLAGHRISRNDTIVLGVSE